MEIDKNKQDEKLTLEDEGNDYDVKSNTDHLDDDEGEGEGEGKRERENDEGEGSITHHQQKKKLRFDLESNIEHEIPSREEMALQRKSILKGKQPAYEEEEGDDEEEEEEGMGNKDERMILKEVIVDEEDGITLYSENYKGKFKQTFDSEAEGIEIKVKYDESDNKTSIVGEERDDNLSLINEEGIENYEENVMPFNFDEEREEGYFDENGHYVMKTKEMLLKEEEEGEELASAPFIAQEDAWLEDTNLYATSDVNTLLKKKKKKEKEENNIDQEEKKEKSENELVQRAYELMRPGETIQQALVRTGASRRRKEPSWKTKRKNRRKVKGKKEKEEEERKEKEEKNGKEGKEKEEEEEEEEEEEKNKKTLEEFMELSDIVSTLSMRNIKWATNIYSMTRDDMIDVEQGIIKKTAKEEEDTTGEVMWEYKRSKEDTEIHGPYRNSDMVVWRKQGYFIGEYTVLIRKVGDDKYVSSETIDFDIYQ